MLAEVVPHVADLRRRLASDVAVPREDHRRLVSGELIELQGRLDQKGDGAVEKVRPNLLLELIEEAIFDDLREVPQTLENHRVLVHDHVQPVVGEDGLRHQLLEHQQDLGEKVLEVKARVEVVHVHLVMCFGHVSEDRKHDGDQIAHQWIVAIHRNRRLNDCSQQNQHQIADVILNRPDVLREQKLQHIVHDANTLGHLESWETILANFPPPHVQRSNLA